ncbi:MAG: hypothetical protein JNK65_01275 [Deltaproteobacteria bacterium]|nr:hypothetical protein [Deltaproteobacteria bacterium]
MTETEIQLKAREIIQNFILTHEDLLQKALMEDRLFESTQTLLNELRVNFNHSLPNLDPKYQHFFDQVFNDELFQYAGHWSCPIW